MRIAVRIGLVAALAVPSDCEQKAAQPKVVEPPSKLAKNYPGQRQPKGIGKAARNLAGRVNRSCRVPVAAEKVQASACNIPSTATSSRSTAPTAPLTRAVFVLGQQNGVSTILIDRSRPSARPTTTKMGSCACAFRSMVDRSAATRRRWRPRNRQRPTLVLERK